jgi:hypothetical protein
LGILGAEELGGRDHVDQSLLGLLPLAGLETTVRVDPELLRLEELEHFLNAVTDLLLAGNTGRVDVVDTRSDVSGVSRVNEDAEELGVRLAVLNGQDVSIESGNGVEEVLELGVTEVRVDLGSILNTGGGQLEGIDGPLKVGVTLLARAERKTLTKSGLIDLNDVDASLLEVNDFVAEGKSELLSLNRLVNVVTRERPSQASDGTSKHTLHGLARDRDGVLGLLDGHGGGAGDVTDNDGRSDAARAVALDPGMGGEGIALQALTKVLDHVVALRLTVDKDVEAKLLLDLDVLLDLGLNELVILLLSDLTLGELVSLNTNLRGLGEGTNGGGGDERQVKLLLLSGNTSGELGLALVVLGSNVGLAFLDLGVVGAGRGGTSLHGLGVGLELLADRGRALSDSLGNDGNLNSLLRGEGEPVGNLGIQLLLAGQGVGSVKERAGGGNNHALLAELLNSALNGLDGTLEVGLPDVAAVNDTSREDSLGAESTGNSLELLRVADKVDVDGMDVLGKEVQVMDDITEVGGEDELGDLVTQAGKLLVGGLESGLGLGGEIKDEGRLIDLDGLGTSLLELDKELLVDRQKLVKKINGVDGLVTVGLAEVEERNGTDKDGTGVNTSLLGLDELSDSLGAVDQLEGLVVLKSRLHVVVVGVEPLDHFQAGDINATLLVSTAHGEVLVDGVKAILGVTLGNGLHDLLDILTLA